MDPGAAVEVALGDEYRQNPRTLTDASTFLVSSSGGGWKVDGIVVATLPVAPRPSPSPSAVDPATADHASRPRRAAHRRRAPDHAREPLAGRSPDRHRRGAVAEPASLRAPPRLHCADDPRSGRDPDRHGHGGAGRAPARRPAARASRVHGPRRHPALPRAATRGRRPSHHRQPAHGYADPVPDRPVVPDPREDRRPAARLRLARHRRSRRLLHSRLVDEPLHRPQPVADGRSTIGRWEARRGRGRQYGRVADVRPAAGARRPGRDRRLVPGPRSVAVSCAWVDTDGTCDASADVVCSAGQPPIEIVAILGPTSPLRLPLP